MTQQEFDRHVIELQESRRRAGEPHCTAIVLARHLPSGKALLEFNGQVFRFVPPGGLRWECSYSHFEKYNKIVKAWLGQVE